MKANLATSLIAYARGGVRKQLLVLCLLTLCVGNMWGGTKRIYCEYSGVSSWWSTIYVYAWGGEHDAKKYTMTATGTSNLVYCDIDDYHTDLLFFKSNSQTGSWETQSVDVSISSNNRWSLGDGGWGNKGTISNQQRYAPGTAIDGLVDIKNPHNQMFTDGTYSTTLEAHKTYEFKILETSTLYGLNDLIATSSISNQTLNTSGYQVRLCTAGAGTYTFAYNSSTHTLSITYPETSHPSIDYCYVIDYSWSPSANLHLWNGTSIKVAEWNGGSTIAGSTWPGAAISNKTTIGGQSYFYIAPGEYANFLVSKSGHETDRSGDLTTSDGYGKRRYWKDETDGWIWDTFTVRIQLENDGADAGHKGTENQDVAFNSDVLSDITCPEKTHYDFQGYYTEVGGTGTQVIDKHGHWIASVSDAAGVPYTDASKHWIHPGTSTTLYAKWTEHEYAITIAVEGSGTTSPASSTIGKIETPSGDITAAPGTGYSFSQWGFSKQGESDYDVWCAAGYTSTNATIRISAKRDGTLTAKFTANNYTVGLDNREADPEHGGTASVNVTYDATTGLTSAITPPQKEHYIFGGYFTEVGGAGTQLINADGSWIKDVTGYTSHDGDNPKWVLADDLTLYAKWTETMYPVAIAISPAGAGNVQVSGETVTEVTAGYATHSPELTAVPSNAAWVFKEWRVDEKLHLVLQPYSQFGEKMKIFATGADQRLTAVFEKRYNLVGSKYEIDKDKAAMATGGMPGWTFGSGADFTINSYTANGDDAIVDLSYTCTLEAGTYIFEIHDRKKGESLGRKDGTSIYVLKDGDNVELRGGEGQDQSIFFYPEHEGQYTFRITNMRKEGEYYYPTVTVERPHAVYFGTGYAGIDDLSSVTSGTAGGTLEVTTSSGALANEDYVTYGTNVTYTPSPETGYTFEGFYTSNEFTYRFTQNNPWIHYNLTGDDHVYAKFVEKATTVTLSNDGHGHVEIDGERASSTTVGITTHRELTAVPDEGYKFDSWTKISGDDITLSPTSENPTTLSGLGAGAVSGQEVRANFDYRWTLKAESDGWGQAEFIIKNISTNASGDVVGYVDISLSANTNYQFTMYDKQESQTYKNGSDQVYYMTNGNSHNWSFATDKRYNCGITTAGAGTYRFIWNITDKKMTVTYPNFVIYRTGDKSDDPRAQNTDVESYEGGLIEKAIEFRMKVRTIDQWYSLSLPFDVSAVKVWDDEDGAYYDIVPYWRTEGTEGTEGTYYTGHYILRKPVTTTNFAIEGFEGKDRWIDPESSDVLPSKNIPYIIQWHDEYFQGKYISFFGTAGQIIPTAMDKGSYASSDEKVNIYGNNSMTTGTVRDAYLLDPYYGTDGAWMREEIGTDRSVLPFECFILANPATTAKYRVLRREMADDTPTGLDTLSRTEDSVSKVMINNRIYIIRGGKIYTIQGTFVKEVE